MSTPSAAPPAETPERLAFYERIGQKHLTPLWTSLCPPRRRYSPARNRRWVVAGRPTSPPSAATNLSCR